MPEVVTRVSSPGIIHISHFVALGMDNGQYRRNSTAANPAMVSARRCVHCSTRRADMAAPFSPIKIHFLAMTWYPAGTALHDGIIFASSQKIALVIGIDSAKRGTRINEGLLECSA